MKSRILLTTILLLVASINLTLGQTQFGTIDYRTCLVLHPEMADFDFVAQRFSRPGLARNNAETMQAIYKRMEAKQRMLDSKMKALQSKQSKIQEEISRTRLNWTAVGAKFAKENMKPDLIERKIEETKIRDQKKIEKLQNEFNDIEDQITGLKDSVWGEVFMTRAETVAKLEKIVQELDLIIKETAEKKRVLTVIDNTLSAPEAIPEILQHIPENTPLWANPAYQIMLKSPLPEPNTFSIANHWAPSLIKSIENMSFQTLAHRNSVGSLVATVRPSKLIISGGMDLTEPVCREMFSKYKFNSYLIESLIKGIKMFHER